MLRDVEVGAHQTEDPIGLVGVGGPHLGAIDEVVIPLQFCLGRKAGKVRPRTRLGISLTPENITVSGHSKGALMSWLTSGFVANPNVNYVIMASCPPEGTRFRRGFNRFLRRGASNVTGRILNLYDVSDDIGGSCAEVFERAGKVSSKELSFDTGKGHGLFYAPQNNWINAASNWAMGENPN